MTIGQVAKQAGVNVQTLRYYERKGLLVPAGRASSGYRYYTPEAVRKIRFIKHAQHLGFSLREIEGLLSLRVDPETHCADVRRFAEQKMAEIETQIAQLKEMHSALHLLAARCDGHVPVSACPIIEAFDEVTEITPEE